jgi:hypothetical protein
MDRLGRQVSLSSGRSASRYLGKDQLSLNQAFKKQVRPRMAETALPLADDRASEGIIGYDKTGLPR